MIDLHYHVDNFSPILDLSFFCKKWPFSPKFTVTASYLIINLVFLTFKHTHVCFLDKTRSFYYSVYIVNLHPAASDLPPTSTGAIKDGGLLDSMEAVNYAYAFETSFCRLGWRCLPPSPLPTRWQPVFCQRRCPRPRRVWWTSTETTTSPATLTHR